VTCPGELELARALSTGGDAELESHLASCASCRAAWDDARAAIELARELPVTMPSAAQREEMRTAILAAAAGPAQRSPRRAWRAPVIAAAAAAAGAIGYLALSAGAPPIAHTHGKLRPGPGARYVVTTVGHDEIVQLSEGALDIEVEPLHPGERFRVVVGASALEVRGTAFRVTADAEHLVEVAVAHGRVDLTPDHGAPATLAAGQAWHAMPVAVRAPSSSAERDAPRLSSTGGADRTPSTAAGGHEPPAVRREPTAVRREPTAVSRAPSTAVGGREPPAVRREPRTVSRAPSTAAAGREPPVARREPLPSSRPAEEAAYDTAWAALRIGDFDRAAEGFARVVLVAPDSPLVEDASFWRAVALARGKRGTEAVSAFRDFLDGFGRSPRAGQASAMLGWLQIDAGAFDDAARRFTAASADPDPKVRDSARAGLAAVAKRRR
jgi:TolA-binding protein